MFASWWTRPPPINSPIHSSRFLPSPSHSLPSLKRHTYPQSPTSTPRHVQRLRRLHLRPSFLSSASAVAVLSLTPLPSPYLQPGDIVAVNNGGGRREGLVVGSHIDHLVRHDALLPAPKFLLNQRVVSISRVVKSSRFSSNPRSSTTGKPAHSSSAKFEKIDASIRYPQVTRVKRTVSYAQPVRPAYRTVERRIMW